MLEAGQTLERYTLLGPLGAGGMAEVWLVRHTRLGTLHALKILNSRHPGLLERLVREGQLQGGLGHPGVVSVTDILEIQGAPGLVLEYVAGPSLDQVLRRHTLPLPALDALGREVLDAMAAAHARGWVHRDLKPGNILLDLRGERARPKVADFGLAKGSIEENPTGPRTRMGATLGTPAYMAPEQVRDSASVDARADVWALGALLYEAACGRQPFRGDDDFDLLAAVTSGRRAPVADLAPHLPARMRDAIERALTVDREARFADAAELRAAWIAGSEGDPEPLLASAPLRPYWQPPSDGTSPTAVPVGTSTHTSSDTAPPSAAPGARAADDTVDDVAWHAVDLDGPTEDELLPPEALPPGPRRRPSGDSSTIADLETPPPADSSVGPRPASPAPEPPREQRLARSGPAPRRWAALAGLLLAGAALAAAAGWYVASAGPVEEHVASAWMLGGELRVGGEVAADARDSRYRLTREGGRITRLAQVNRAGSPLPLWQSRPIQELVALRDEDGELTGWEARNPKGGPEHRLALERDGDAVVVRHLGAHGAPQASPLPLFGLLDTLGPSEVLVERVTHPEPDRWRVRFERPTGAPQAVDGAFGTDVVVDAEGRLVSRTPLDLDGQPGVDAFGVARVTWRYEDPRHPALPTRVRHETPQGGLISGEEGWAEVVLARDDRGDLSIARWFGPSGQPTWGPEGCHAIRYERVDAEHRLTCLDADDQIMVSKEQWAIHVTTHDARGYGVHVATLDPNGAPMVSQGLAASYDRAYEDDGLVTRQGPWYDTLGRPVPSPDGSYFSRVVAHDDLGRVSMERFLGQDGKPVPGPAGPAEIRTRTSEGDRLVEELAFDAAGQPTVFSGAVHRISYATDRGRVTQEDHYDTQGRLVADDQGVARRIWSFDAQGNLEYSTTLDAALQPVGAGEAGAARIDERWDEHGRLLEMAWFGTDGQPLPGPNGCVREAYEVNAAGWRVTTRCLDAAGQPATSAADWSVARSTYDSAGRDTSNAFEALGGGPAPGCSKEVFEHDARGRETYVRCYDASGYPAPFDEGDMATLHRAYDDLDRLVLSETLGVAGQRVTDPKRGCAAVRWAFHGGTDLVRELWYEGPDGEPILNPSRGYAGFRLTYDALNRFVGEVFMGPDRQPMMNPVQGYASRVLERDALGNVRLSRVFGPDGAPLPPPAGAVGTYQYDDLGRVDAITWTDADGAPAVGPEGHHRTRCVRGISGDCLRWVRTLVDGTELPESDWEPG